MDHKHAAAFEAAPDRHDTEDNQSIVGNELEDELPEAYCGGCGRLIDEDSVDEGIIQFATKLWHVECFRCAKCKNKVSTERDDILLLSDGHPICGECNYSCNICGLPIMEEAIMTGDESYHASCFTCRACHSKIEELVFAKTSQGIYCMKCHNDRVAKSRRHAEQKKAKARERQLRQAASTTSAEGEASRMGTNGTLGLTSASNPAEARSPAALTASSSPSSSAFRSTFSSHLDPARKSPSLDGPPPMVPSKDPEFNRSLNGTLGGAKLSTTNSSSSMSHWQPSNGTTPGSSSGANSKRPTQAPPPLARDLRLPPVSKTSPSTEYRSLGSANDHIDDHHAYDHNALASSSTLSKQNQTEVGSTVSRSTSLERTADTKTPLTSQWQADAIDAEHKADSSRRTFSEREVNGFKNRVKTSSHFSSGSEGEHDSVDAPVALTRASRVPVSAPSTEDHLSARTKGQFPPPVPTTRMSKTYSFYDPDFLNLMDSFGRFDSNDDFKLSSPMLEEMKQQSTESDRPKKGGTSAAATLEKTLPAEDSVKGSDTLTQVEQALEVDDSEEEVLVDEKRGSTASLVTISAKMRASMQQATDGQVNMDLSFVEMVLKDLEDTREKMTTLQVKYDRIKRASQQAAHGFSMAKEEYEQEVNARHEAELEMARLRSQLAEHALKLATITSEKRQQEQLERRSQDVKASLMGMERDLAKLTVERDLTVAEMAELLALQDGSSQAHREANGTEKKNQTITNNLASRLEAVKSKYRKEIDELTLERDSLLIEIEELKQSRDLYLQESQTLNAKNEELNTVMTQLTRRVDMTMQARGQLPALPRSSKDLPPQHYQASSVRAAGGFGFGFGKQSNKQYQIGPPSTMPSNTNDSLTSSGLEGSIDSAVQKYVKPEKIEPAPMAKKFKWMKPKLSDTSKNNSNGLSNANGSVPPLPPKSTNPTTPTRNASHDIVVREHIFQPFNVLRPTRCMACQKSMWGQSEMRCAICNGVCHSRCMQNVPLSCSQPYTRPEDVSLEPPGPSMFGKDLIEQAALESRDVPLIVEKCIQAVEAFGMDYEGIYRKSGGTSQLKVITQLFERGTAFNLEDPERFNDISAITSVLKNYFRELPTPLLTFELHEDFIQVAESKAVPSVKADQMAGLIAQLPRQHYCTLKHLILHLHGVQEKCNDNRMNARNLGVVFGPTLMRSGDPTQEFAHMGGKALTIEFFIEHAQNFFP